MFFQLYLPEIRGFDFWDSGKISGTLRKRSPCIIIIIIIFFFINMNEKVCALMHFITRKKKKINEEVFALIHFIVKEEKYHDNEEVCALMHFIKKKKKNVSLMTLRSFFFHFIKKGRNM